MELGGYADCTAESDDSASVREREGKIRNAFRRSPFVASICQGRCMTRRKMVQIPGTNPEALIHKRHTGYRVTLILELAPQSRFHEPALL
jgi:hypothetical protein